MKLIRNYFITLAILPPIILLVLTKGKPDALAKFVYKMQKRTII